MIIKTIQQAFNEADNVFANMQQSENFDEEIKAWRLLNAKVPISEWDMNHCVRLVAYFRQPSERKKYSWNAVFMANDLWKRYNFKYETQEEYIYYKIASIKPTCNTIAVFDNRPGAPGIIMNKWSYGKWQFMDYKNIKINLR